VMDLSSLNQEQGAHNLVATQQSGRLERKEFHEFVMELSPFLP
jgi:hypothetical protein